MFKWFLAKNNGGEKVALPPLVLSQNDENYLDM